MPANRRRGRSTSARPAARRGGSRAASPTMTETSDAILVALAAAESAPKMHRDEEDHPQPRGRDEDEQQTAAAAATAEPGYDDTVSPVPRDPGADAPKLSVAGFFASVSTSTRSSTRLSPLTPPREKMPSRCASPLHQHSRAGTPAPGAEGDVSVDDDVGRLSTRDATHHQPPRRGRRGLRRAAFVVLAGGILASAGFLISDGQQLPSSLTMASATGAMTPSAWPPLLRGLMSPLADLGAAVAAALPAAGRRQAARRPLTCSVEPDGVDLREYPVCNITSGAAATESTASDHGI